MPVCPGKWTSSVHFRRGRETKIRMAPTPATIMPTSRVRPRFSEAPVFTRFPATPLLGVVGVADSMGVGFSVAVGVGLEVGAGVVLSVGPSVGVGVGLVVGVLLGVGVVVCWVLVYVQVAVDPGFRSMMACPVAVSACSTVPSVVVQVSVVSVQPGTAVSLTCTGLVGVRGR